MWWILVMSLAGSSALEPKDLLEDQKVWVVYEWGAGPRVIEAKVRYELKNGYVMKRLVWPDLEGGTAWGTPAPKSVPYRFEGAARLIVAEKLRAEARELLRRADSVAPE